METTTEPERLLATSDSELERALLNAGTRVSTHSLRRAQVLTAVGVGSAVAFGSKTSLAMAAGWKKLLVGGVVACTGATTVVAYRVMSEPQQDAASVTYQHPPTGAGVRAQAPAQEIDQAPEHTSQPEAHGQMDRLGTATTLSEAMRGVHQRAAKSDQGRAVLTAKRKPARSDKRASSSLKDEVAQLDSARSALRSAQPSAALNHLNEYARRFPRGTLHLEAEALRIEAFASSGKDAEASKRARRILDRSPNSVLAARLRRYVLD
jgi:hypothetical protein